MTPIRLDTVYMRYLQKEIHEDGYPVLVDVLVGTYKTIRFALECTNAVYREVVVYEGLDGDDQGKWFVATLADFSTKLKLQLPQSES